MWQVTYPPKPAAKRPTVEQLAQIFRMAKANAEAAALFNTDDGGTCNFDSPAFRIERMPAKQIEKAAELAGVTVTDFTWFGGRRWYWLGGFLRGQGALRTRMMEAALDELKERLGPFEAASVSGYYQAD